MKKIILAAAILAPLGLAHAQSSVTIYGNLDAAVVAVNPGNGTSTPGGSIAANPVSQRAIRLDSGVGPGSRFGFRGVEDLGDGLLANFLLEGGIAVDTGVSQQGGVLFGRQAFVGLAKNAWALSAGRQYSPLDVIFATNDPQYGLYWGNIVTATNHAIYPTIGATASSGSWQGTSRINNSVLGSYTANGFTTKLMVAAGDENTRGTGRLINPSVTYTNGPLSLSVTGLRVRQAADSIIASATPEWQSEAIVAGSYAFEAAKISAGMYQFVGANNQANFSPAATLGNAAASPYAYTWSRLRSYWVGARVPLGTGTFIGSLGRIDYIHNATPNGHGTVLGLVYEYPLSKRTILYTNYGQVSNNAYSNGPMFSTVTALNANGYGAKLTAFAVGMRHSF